MPPRKFWLDLFTYQTWREFLDAGATVSGFRESSWNTVSSMNQGDYLLCYLTGISRWIGILEVVGPAFRDSQKIWSVASFSARVPVKVVAALDPDTAVPVLLLRDELSLFKELRSPHAWTGWFRRSPAQWSEADGEAVVAAVNEAVGNPVKREFSAAKLNKVPPIFLRTSSGMTVTVPQDDPVEEASTAEASEADAAASVAGTVHPVSGTEHGSAPNPPSIDQQVAREESAHTEVQWLLAKLGSDMGLDVWIAKNDKNKSFKGNLFNALPKLRKTLPLSFDDVTTRTVELIDLLWLKGNSIVAAFEIESTTQVFSGLLRLADLLAMQPNLDIPLYIVAPSERRTKVVSEMNRPVFAKFEPPMSSVCQLITFEDLRESIKSVTPFAQHLKPDFIASIAESCALEDV